MRAVDVIRQKRDRQELTRAEIEAFSQAAADGSWPDYQLSALLMAIFLNGMTPAEAATLTAAMAGSGTRYRWDDVPGPKVDKHSTGGVGDKTSLILAPLAAACGVIVPMMSGRGLGHTGGTLDKLEAMPGFRVGLEEDELRTALKKIGVGMIGQTARVAPADRKLYALRDVTGTIESIPLITASILSKKLAEGIDALVMDVKAGCGAFMKTRARARALAQSIVGVGNANGVPTEALITAMDVPLGRTIGNALEVMECLETLKGRGPKDLEDLSVILAARMVRLAKLATADAEAEAKVRVALTSGAGLEKFRQIVAQQGGDPRIVDDYAGFAKAPKQMTINAERPGYVTDLHAEKIGVAGMMLGAGRNRAEDKVDHAVGVVIRAHMGERVSVGDAILEVHYRDDATLANALPLMRGAIAVGEVAPPATELVMEVCH
ncbi:MAG TPA: thymidine phosphorylase [Gemmataceae bacterium]|jgi:pyrimidine-nucleoside phosphorylase|nr:thymidine phosphorylase [Gemmataceae bacterium]